MYFLLQKPSHILACNLQADSISWLYMASDLNVVDWKHEIIFERIRAKYDHILYQNKVRVMWIMWCFKTQNLMDTYYNEWCTSEPVKWSNCKQNKL